MKGIEGASYNLRYLDELALQPTPLRGLDPTVKLVTTVVFIIVVASFPRYALLPLLPLTFYPTVLMAWGELPVGYLVKRMLWAAPFVLFVAAFNPLLDRTPLLRWGSVVISGGWVSFGVVMLKFALTVLAALILIATTGMNQIGAALRRIGLPRELVGQLLFLYRYLFVLLEEATRMYRAYYLRASGRQGVRFPAWGSLAGQLLLRTFDRAQRIYQAMLCRGYHGEICQMAGPTGPERRFSNGIFLGGWTGFFLLARAVNLPQLLDAWWWRVFK